MASAFRWGKEKLLPWWESRAAARALRLCPSWGLSLPGEDHRRRDRLGWRRLDEAFRAEDAPPAGNVLSMISQDPMTSLNPVLNIETQLGEGLRLHKGMDAKAARERCLNY